MSDDIRPLAAPDRDLAPDDARMLWQGQPAESFRLSAAQLRARIAHATRARRRLQLLGAVQHVGTLFGIVATTVVAVRVSDPLMRAGAVLLAIVFVYRWIVLRHTATASREPAGALVSTEPSLVAYRAALLRRLAEDRGPLLWSRLAIGAPAAAMFLYGFARAKPSLAPIIAVEAIAIAAGLGLAFTIAARRARRYQAELDSLDSLERDAPEP